MKPSIRNPFLGSALLLGAASVQAVDINYGDTLTTFSVTSSDSARTIGGSSGGTPVFNDNGLGSVYDRGGDQDVTYFHFDLSPLLGGTISGDVSLNLSIDATYGGAMNNGLVATPNTAWSYPGTSPGFSAIGDSLTINGNFNTNDVATWTISNATFSGFLADPLNFTGLAVTAGDASLAHFNAPATLTGGFSGGEVRVVNASNWSAASYDNGSNTLSISGSGDVTGGDVVLTSGTTLALSDAATLDGGSFGGLIVNGGTLSFGSSANQSLLGTIRGGGALDKSGSGTLTLAGNNLYGGVTNILAGTLLATSNSALGAGGHNGATMSFIQDGATLALQGGVSLPEHFHVWGDGVGGLGAVRSISGNNALPNSPGGGPGFALRSNTTVSVEADRLTASGFYQEAGTFGLTKIGNGTLALTAESTYLGGTTVEAGTLEMAGNSGLGRIRGALTVNNGALVELTGDGSGLGYYDQITSLNINNGAVVNSAGTQHVWRIGGGVNLAGGTLRSNNGTSDPNGPQLEWGNTAVFASGDATSTIAGRIRNRVEQNPTISFTVDDGAQATDLLVSAAITQTGTTTISKSGSGTMLLTGANDYSGGTVVNGGELRVGDGTSPASLGSGPVTNNASLVIHPPANLTLGQAISGSGSLTKSGTATLSLTGPNTYTGDTIVDGGTLELLNNSGSVVNATVTNAGFESPDFAPGGWSYLGNDGIVAWSISGGGIASGASPWVATAPEGDQAGYIQLNGSISQTITVNQDGEYVVRFQTANRPGYTASDLTVSIEATQVGSWSAAQLASGGAFVSRVSNPINLTAGTYTLTFTGTGSGDTATAIDAVSVTKPATLTNGQLTFRPEATGVSNKITGSGAASLNGRFHLDLSAADIADGNSWTLVDHATLAEGYGSDFFVTSNLGAFSNNAGVWSLEEGDNTWSFDTVTGVLMLAVEPSDPFASWMSTNYGGILAPDNEAGADPDDDGIVNLLEYVLLGGDPSVANPGILPTLDASGANFVFEFTRRPDSTADTTQTFQYGTDLSGWTTVTLANGTNNGATVSIAPSGPNEVVNISVPKGTNPRLFGRLQVTKP
jgi:autotransporter-associated beta strand protein